MVCVPTNIQPETNITGRLWGINPYKLYNLYPRASEVMLLFQVEF